MKKPLIKYIMIFSVSLAVCLVAYFFFLPDSIPVQLTTEGIRYANKATVFIFAFLPALVVWSIDCKRLK